VSSIGGVPPVTFQTLPAHTPLGKPTVGLDSVNDRDSPLPPVEESEEAERLRHRDVVVKLRDEHGQQHHQEQPSGDTPPQDQTDREHAAEQSLEAQLNPAAQTAPVLPVPAIYQARHLGEFEQNILPPGSLLDQQV
jgi:hypothetical protein